MAGPCGVSLLALLAAAAGAPAAGAPADSRDGWDWDAAPEDDRAFAPRPRVSGEPTSSVGYRTRRLEAVISSLRARDDVEQRDTLASLVRARNGVLPALLQRERASGGVAIINDLVGAATDPATAGASGQPLESTPTPTTTVSPEAQDPSLGFVATPIVFVVIFGAAYAMCGDGGKKEKKSSHDDDD